MSLIPTRVDGRTVMASESRSLRNIAILLLLALVGTVGATSVVAQETGQQLATDYCSNCHRVTLEQGMPPPVVAGTERSAELIKAPSFRGIAAKEAKDRDYPRNYIQQPHYPMPEQLFIPAELGAIIDYILSLRQTSADWRFPSKRRLACD
ncbi:MAG: c-type cytochrome [Dongiaceae bacterium]